MKKLYKLKEWYSLEDAAKRLTLTLNEEITVKDILQLFIEGHLELSWYMRNIHAQKVAPYTKILNWDKKFGTLFSVMHDEENQNYVKYDRSKVTHAVSTYEDNSGIVSLNGIFNLDLEESSSTKDWILSIITNTINYSCPLDGFFVRDDKDNLWRIMERHNFNPFEEGEYKKDDNKPIMHRDNFFPSAELPSIEDIGVCKTVIESLEKHLCAEEPVNDNMQNINNESQTQRKLNNVLKLLFYISEDKFNHSHGKEKETANKLETFSPVGKQSIKSWLVEGYELVKKDNFSN
jgi:hypothetical protein